MNSVRSEWRVEDFEQEVSLYFIAPDLTLDLDTPLRNQSSSATLQPSGTVTPIPNTNNNNRNRRSSFLKFNLADLFRPPQQPIISPNIGFEESDTHLTSAVSPSFSSPQMQTRQNSNNNNLVSLPSISSASVSTYASASAFTVASSHPSLSTYVSASASVAPSSVSTSGGRSRRSRRTPSHFSSSSSCSYSYPYSDYYMSSSSGLSIQDNNYLEDIAAGIDNNNHNNNTTELEEPPISPTTTTTSTSTTSPSISFPSSSSSSPKRSSNLVRRLRLRGGADESYLKLKAGISSSGGIFSSPSLNKSPSRAKSRTGSKDDDGEEDDNNNNYVYPRPNPNSKFKKRLIFIELDEQGHMIDRRGNKTTTTTTSSSSYRTTTDETTLRQRDGHHHHNDTTIGKSTNSPLAIAAEHLSSTLSHNPLFQLRFRKQKRLLVKDIPTDDGEYTRSRIVALRQWAESLGAVRRLLRSVPDGTIWIEFKDREVAENVCHLHAHVHIPNVGRVRLDWVEGREAG